MVFQPEYIVRNSSRAKRIRLRILPGRGLEVVLPMGADAACVPFVIQQHQDWIEKHLARLQMRRAEPPGKLRLPPPASSEDVVFDDSPAGNTFADSAAAGGAHSPAPLVPEGLYLHGGQEYIHIQRRRSLNAQRCIVLPATLHPQLAPRATLAWLREWVRREARQYCGRMLQQLATLHAYPFADMRIKFQRTRWGSCSLRGNINVNACLLFLPEALTRYVLIHELCHTKELNHSERFWKLVFEADPDAMTHDAALRRAWRYVPDWVLSFPEQSDNM